MDIWITVGPPAVGKSTWAKEMVSKSKGTIKHVNRDTLRGMIDNGKYSKDNEAVIVKARNSLVSLFLEEGYSVIVDDTNLSNNVFKDMVGIAYGLNKKATVTIREKHFDKVDRKVLVFRDSHREDTVGEEVIKDMYNAWLARTPHSNVTVITGFSLRQNAINYSSDLEKDPAVIIDIDGTLALTDPGDRSMFDYFSAISDYPNFPLIKILEELPFKKILLTGRGEEGREVLEKWLKTYNIAYDELFMRPKPLTYIKDYLFKEGVLIGSILPKYQVVAAFEDRDTVSNMWRRNGILCLQTQKGV